MADQIPTRGLSSRNLAIGLWWTSNKLLLKNIFIGFLIALNVSLYGFSIYKAIDIFVIDQENHKIFLSQLSLNYIDYKFLRGLQKANSLEFSQTLILPSNNGKDDLVVNVVNPNDNFMVESITYQFFSGENILGEGTAFFYPNEEKYISVLAVDANTRGEIGLRIVDIDWQRIDSSFSSYVNERKNFTVGSIQFTPAFSLSGGRGSQVSQTKFTLTNNSIFSFWRVDAHVFLYNGTRLVATSITSIDQIVPLESREIMINWLTPLSRVTRTEIYPDVNVLDEDNYMEYIVTPGEAK